MQRRLVHTLLLPLASALLAVNVSTATLASEPTVSESAVQLWESIKSYSAEKSEEAAEASAEMMDDLGDRWDALKEGSADVAEDTQDKMAELMEQARDASERMQTATGEAWEEAREDFDNAYREIEALMAEQN